MDESILTRIISTINHNADLLERHLNEGVYVHYQQEPSTSWSVTHSLGSLRPLIEVYDSNGNRIGFAVNRQTQTLTFAEINFAIAVSGVAIFRY
ncbi:MAG: hypothetical protein LBB88_10980 [Planctomycetaceae bacterium]|jgi:hypothetical protein|nr:hypothetical protein [Planctomycetaceae bacterium]